MSKDFFDDDIDDFEIDNGIKFEEDNVLSTEILDDTGRKNGGSSKSKLVIPIVLGVTIMVIGGFIMSVVNKSDNKEVLSASGGTSEITSITSQTTYVDNSVLLKNNDDNEYTEVIVDSSKLVNKGSIDTQFNVTDVKSFIHKSSDGTISIEGKLVGTLDGIGGIVSLSVPYSKSSKVSIGTVFSVNVTMYEYNECKLLEINY